MTNPTAERLRTIKARYKLDEGPLANTMTEAANLIDQQAEIIDLYKQAEAQRATDLARYLGSNLNPLKLSETPA